MNKAVSVIKSVVRFYTDGFQNMPGWGRKVWIVILIKLFIIFVVLKIFFFPDILKKGFRSDSERSTYMRDQLININSK
ncbi:MAG TPA: DUF4492 domain-containing protein [Bacteroidales bacterium]|nr:DUF4492 domain-containing protein [Bacteroidales bacterium]